ncbi:unnamed protein product [Clonostachys rosea]|uniref:Enoyl reductase (ER) domain-containing protein n=1 Tax=Bionectria ochroleuca TaxID=29856 RepID=A0ABY6UPZ7_BIOOC|nr:unnamed protein product [Clonostachys rosea]
MTMAQTAVSWSIDSQTSDLSGLVLQAERPIPGLGDKDVLVELRAASLNYRELVVVKSQSGLVAPRGAIPGSDGAGVVVKVGSQVQNFRPNDKVITHMIPDKFPNDATPPLGDDELPGWNHICAGLGQEMNGTLTTYGVFPESCLVKFGDGMSFAEAATLTCSGITAWNALMGLDGKQVKKGDWVIVQGSGGVSVAALQFAVAVGATVVATTSSDEKGSRLKALGASYIVNYRQTPSWGAAAKELTPSGRGFDIVVDVGGNATLPQSVAAVRRNGVITIVGMVGKADVEPTPLMAVLFVACVVRGILLGSREMMRDMVEFVGKNEIRLALDDEVFALVEVKGAFKKLEEQKHFSKVVIQIPGE